MPTPLDLKVEIIGGPLKTELAPFWNDPRVHESRDGNIARILNERRFNGRRPAPVVELERLAFRRGVISKLEVGKDNASDAVKGLCRTALRVFDGNLTEVDMDNDATIALFNGLVQANIFTDADRSAAFALGDSTVSRAEQLWGVGSVITVADVEAARKA